MSIRGSSNAVRFAGKSWRLIKSVSPSIKLNDKEARAFKKAEKKAKKIKKQFDVLLKNFSDDNSVKTEDLFKIFESKFSMAMRYDSVKYYKQYKRKSDNSVMSIQEYFSTKPWKSIEPKSISYFRTKFISIPDNLSPKSTKK